MKNTLLVLAILYTSFTIAQKVETPPDYQYNIGQIGKGGPDMYGEEGAFKMTLSQGGIIFGFKSFGKKDENGIYALKPESNDFLFKFLDYGRKIKNKEFVPNTPYMIIEKEITETQVPKNEKTVINYITGKKIFNSKEKGWKYMDLYVMQEHNKLVVSGMRDKTGKWKTATAIYNLDTGEQEGYAQLKTNDFSYGRPILVSDGLIIPTMFKVKKIDLINGTEIWTTKAGGISKMVVDKTGKEIYGYSFTSNGNTKIYKFDFNGNLLWSKPHKVKGKITRFEILPQGLAIVSDVADPDQSGISFIVTGSADSKIAFLNASTGEDLWEKAPKTKGYVQHFYIMEDGILFGLYGGGINKVSFDGKPLFKKPLKTGENIITMVSTPLGLLYITSEDANIVNMETGEQVWDKPLNYKKADVVSSDFDVKNNQYLINADEELFSININTGESKILATTKFKGKEKPTQMEVREGGIFLSSSQNIALLDWDGKTLWNKYYPGSSKQLENILGFVTSMLLAAGTDMAQDYFADHKIKNVQFNYSESERFEEQMVLDAHQSISNLVHDSRYKATTVTKNHQFVLTKLEEGIALVKLNKDTGEVEKEIITNDNSPNYIIDEYRGILYIEYNPTKMFKVVGFGYDDHIINAYKLRD